VQTRVFILGAAALFLMSAVSACDGGLFGTRGSGHVITETLAVGGFREIALFGSGLVRVDVNGTESLIVEAKDTIMPLLTTEVRDGRLELSVESRISPTSDITCTVSADSLDGVTITGSGDVTATGIAADSFDVEISGSGRVEPTGTTNTLIVESSGSGHYLGENLAASVGAVEVSGSGEAVVNVTNNLAVDVSGSGEVQYIENPALTESKSGLGSITRK